MFQALEVRQFLSGAVHAQVHHGALVLQGDDAANAILVYRDGSDQTSFRIAPLNGTEINGSTKPAVFFGVDRGVFSDLGGGNDSLTLSGLRIFGAVEVEGDDGNDSLLVRSTKISGGLTWLGESGDDSVLVRNSIVQRSLDLGGGEGRDRFGFATDHIRQGLHFADTSGASDITFDHLSVDKLASIRTGNSIDHVNVADSTFKSDVSFALSGGNDQVKVRGTVFHASSPIHGGAGHNTIDREVMLSWDFRNGAQGWTAGFADYPAGQIVTSDGQTAEQYYQLKSGVEPLPGSVKVDGTGYLLSGANHSDDLSMYLARRISPEDGLVPGVSYQASFTLKLASNVPAGLVGIGGPPAEAVHLNAVAVPQKIELVVAPGDENARIKNYTLNFSRVGARLGNIANGGPAVLHDIYRVITKSGDDSDSINTNAAGGLILVVGTLRSGFEGTTSLYYMTVSVQLTPTDGASRH